MARLTLEVTRDSLSWLVNLSLLRLSKLSLNLTSEARRSSPLCRVESLWSNLLCTRPTVR